MHELHRIEPRHREIHNGLLVVLEASEGIVCLFVDEVLYQIQTVIKSLSSGFGRIEGISGCNILGSGEVSLILDIDGVLRSLARRGENMVTGESQPVES